MEEFAEEITGCGASPETVFRHESKLNSIEKLLDKMDKKIDELGVIHFLNGPNGDTPMMMNRQDYFQHVYNLASKQVPKEDFEELSNKVTQIDEKLTTKHRFESLSLFSQKIIPILTLIGILVSVWLSVTAIKSEKDFESKVKTEQSTNK